MERKVIAKGTVESTKFLIQFSQNPQKIIDNILYTTEITPEFIGEFRQYITKENFSSSYKLQLEMVNKYPEFFSESIFLEGLKEPEVEEELSIFSGISEPGKNENISRISLSMLNHYFDEIKKISKNLEADVLAVIRNSTKEEAIEDNICNLFGISYSIDDILFKRGNEDTRKALLLRFSALEDRKIPAAFYKYMGKEEREASLANISDMREFILILSTSHDLFWKTEMLKKALNEEIHLNETKENLTIEGFKLAQELPEDSIVNLVKLSDKANLLFSYETLKEILNTKSFTEEQLIEMYSYLKKYGLYFDLKKLAEENNYEEMKKIL